MNLLTVALLLAATAATAADIAYFRGSPERLATNREGSPPASWFPRIVLVGEIAPGDDNRLSKAIEQAQADGLDWWASSPQLQLDSQGGDVATAMSIGRKVRKARLSTWIQPNGICASACVIVFAGGVHRHASENSRIGLHRPYFASAATATANGYERFQQAYSSVLDAHRAYFSEMGVGHGLLDLMTQIPSNELLWINRATATRLKLLGEDPAFAEWQRAARTARRGPACVAWEDKYFDCVIRRGKGVAGTLTQCEKEAGERPQNCD